MAIYSLLVSSIFLVSIKGSSVPILTWSYDDSLVLPISQSILSGHTLISSDVYKKYLQPICNKNNVMFMFLQDELSVDDFTKYPSSFPFIKETLSSRKHFVLPSVSQEEKNILDVIKADSHVAVKEIFPNEPDNWGSYLSKELLNKEQVNVFVIHLQPVRDTDVNGRQHVLKQNDLAIKTLISKFSELLDHFVVMYTAQEPAMKISSILVNEQLEVSNLHSPRHLLASAEQNVNSFFNNSGCVYLYAKHMKFGSSNNQLTDFINATSNHASGSCEKGMISSIKLVTISDVGKINKGFAVTISMKETNSEWFCESIVVKGVFNKTQIDLTYNCSGQANVFEVNSHNTIVSPVGLSFSCNKMKFDTGTYTLEFDDFQLQPSVNGTSGFSGAYSCVGFFTLEILTGIFVVSILIVGLFLGTVAMMSIQTQDRFDDPKGKTITVATTE